MNGTTETGKRRAEEMAGAASASENGNDPSGKRRRTAMGAQPPEESIPPSTSAAPETVASAATSSSTSATGQPTSERRWRSHVQAEDYISLASNLLLPTVDLGPFGYDSTTGHYPTERVTALGLLTSPVRRPTVIEKWNPYEICVFEASMALYGKDFHEVARAIGTKCCKEVVEFYYVWKKTEHYKVWKKGYTPHLGSDHEE